jgi:hypothetical protein
MLEERDAARRLSCYAGSLHRADGWHGSGTGYESSQPVPLVEAERRIWRSRGLMTLFATVRPEPSKAASECGEKRGMS